MKLHLCLLLMALSAAAPLTTLNAATAVPLTPPERTELLSRLEALRARYPAIESGFTEHRTSHLLKRPVTSSGTIAFQIPNKFRRQVDGSNPSLTVSNGRQLWIYYPNFKEVEEYTLGQRAVFDDAMAALTAGLNFSRVENYYNLEAAREDGGYVLTLIPKKSSLKRTVQQLTVFLDSDLNVRHTDLILPNGDHIATTYSAQHRGALPASTFEFTPPSDATVTHPLGK